jgi:hypothetical protein
MVSIAFLFALVVVSLITSILIGVGVQLAASQWQLGPIPRAFVGITIILPVTVSLVIDLGIIRMLPVVLLIYYLGTFQIGTRLGHAAGLQAPDDNDPPDFIWDMMNRYE